MLFKKKNFSTGYTFNKEKLDAILTVICCIINYNMIEGELEAIYIELENSNAEENKWGEYTMNGENCSVYLKIAYDDKDCNDLIVISITSDKKIEEKLNAIYIVQELFSEVNIYSHSKNIYLGIS